MLLWAAPASAQTVWELTPYRVGVIVAAGSTPELTSGLQADLKKDLTRRADALIGAAWKVSLVDMPAGLESAMVSDLQAVTTDSLPQEWLDSEQFDKIMLVAVLPGPVGHRVAARELDVRTRTWSTVVSVPVWHLAKLRDAAFWAMQSAFAPLAQIAAVDPDTKEVILRLRAAGFPARDPSFVPARPGDLFQPVIRYNERSGRLRGVNPIPWTLLTVEKVNPSGLSCKLHTGLRTPLSGRRRGRVEQLALGVIPPGKPTRLELHSRTDASQVLAGYDVYSHPPDSKATELLGRTDRQGSLMIEPGGHPLRVLLVKHGGEFLARLPLVPGIDAEVAAGIANDDQRLEVEGFIKGIEEELIDLVTRREVLKALIQKRIEEKQFDEADKLVWEFRSLKSRDDFILSLTQEQKKVYSDDKLMQARIDQMFKKTRELVHEYLNPAVVDRLVAQIREARDSGPL